MTSFPNLGTIISKILGAQIELFGANLDIKSPSMLILIMSFKSCGNADHTEIQINYPHKQAKRFDKTKCEKAKKKPFFVLNLRKGN